MSRYLLAVGEAAHQGLREPFRMPTANEQAARLRSVLHLRQPNRLLRQFGALQLGASAARVALVEDQVINRAESPVRVLMLSTMISPEITEYLDSGKILLKDAKDDDIFQGRLGPELESWDDED